MAGLRDLLPGIAATVQSQLGVTYNSAPVTLSDTRILGSTDATFGAVGWLPELNGRPFCVIEAEGFSDFTPEPNRVWADYHISLFVAVEHADTPSVNENYNDLALAWLDAARPMIASNRRLLTYSQALWPTSGDVIWELLGGKIISNYRVYGVEYYGVHLHTKLRLVISVNYQS